MKDYEMIDLYVFNGMNTRQLLMFISAEARLKIDSMTLLIYSRDT